MTDDRDKLKQSLQQLEAQLAEVNKLDPDVAARLGATLAEARAALAGQPGESSTHRSLAERLSDTVLELEASHPKLAASLGGIVDAMAQIGI